MAVVKLLNVTKHVLWKSIQFFSYIVLKIEIYVIDSNMKEDPNINAIGLKKRTCKDQCKSYLCFESSQILVKIIDYQKKFDFLKI